MIAGARQHIPAADARRLFMQGLAMLDTAPAPSPAAAPATPTEQLAHLLRRLAFVQLDSIHVVERAHHHILWSRWPQYTPAMIDSLYQQRLAFEHWTHDASLIPVEWLPYWRFRFNRYKQAGAWMRKRLGPGAHRTIRTVLARIRDEGPLMSKDFADAPASRPGKTDPAGWWNWKPQKAALEYLWRTGQLSIAARVNFHKVYDLTERVFPEVAAGPAPSSKQHIEWACTTAIERLGIATPREIAAFWNAITIQQSREWCAAAARAGRIIPVTVEGVGDAPRQSKAAGPHHGFAIADYADRLARAPEPRANVRFLSPFDPLIRDRPRALRLFNFDYRFEAFTPAAKRKYGYYVLPILEGDRLIGRIDPQLDRARGTLALEIFWEPGIRSTRQRTSALKQAAEDYARFNRATTWTIER